MILFPNRSKKERQKEYSRAGLGRVMSGYLARCEIVILKYPQISWPGLRIRKIGLNMQTIKVASVLDKICSACPLWTIQKFHTSDKLVKEIKMGHNDFTSTSLWCHRPQVTWHRQSQIHSVTSLCKLPGRHKVIHVEIHKMAQKKNINVLFYSLVLFIYYKTLFSFM